ncbi:hypothetical protein BC831DRAFT_458891 [Entophlyctis helioformis]|nr:hypothetical protein BC831DRAFT_458891 [Entophlyctis helioformis]
MQSTGTSAAASILALVSPFSRSAALPNPLLILLYDARSPSAHPLAGSPIRAHSGPIHNICAGIVGSPLSQHAIITAGTTDGALRAFDPRLPPERGRRILNIMNVHPSGGIVGCTSVASRPQYISTVGGADGSVRIVDVRNHRMLVSPVPARLNRRKPAAKHINRTPRSRHSLSAPPVSSCQQMPRLPLSSQSLPDLCPEIGAPGSVAYALISMAESSMPRISSPLVAATWGDGSISVHDVLRIEQEWIPHATLSPNSGMPTAWTIQPIDGIQNALRCLLPDAQTGHVFGAGDDGLVLCQNE